MFICSINPIEILLLVIHHLIIFHLHRGQVSFYFVSFLVECGQYDDGWTQEFDLFDILVIFSWGVNWMGHETDHSVQLVLSIRISGAILPLPHPQWHTQAEHYLLFFVCLAYEV